MTANQVPMNDLDQALALDSKHRQQALSLTSLIVEAPAGAGKTELLTQRFLALLQTVQTPEEIIAITFTNKAASEMRARILDSLAMAQTGIAPPAAHKQITFQLGLAALQRSAELGWRLLESPARLRIYTIDALCGNLARQMPLLSRFGTQPAVTEDAWSYYHAAAQQVIDSMDDPHLGSTVQRVLRYLDNDQAKLEALLVAMLAKREQWLPIHQRDEVSLSQAALTWLITSELAEVMTVLPARTQQALMPIARYAASQLEDTHPLAALRDWQTPLAADLQDLPQWRALAECLLTSAGELRKRVDKNMGLGPSAEAKPHKEALLALLDDLRMQEDSAAKIARIRALPSPLPEEADIIQALRLLLSLAAAALWLRFQADNVVDFIEIAQRALQALVTGEEASDLAMRLDYRISHLLVDEFQDTSPMQIRLLEALTRGWQPDDGRTLFAVGDPMQSIYRFRKANVGLFLKATTAGIGDIALTSLKLWRNNRSCPAIIDWINQTFVSLLPSEDVPSQGAIRYRPFVATRPALSGEGVQVHPFILDEADGVSMEVVRQQEAERMIRIIQDTRQQHPDARIAVLVRARKHLHALVSEMRRHHRALSFQAVEIEELANRQIVQDCLTLTYALHQRADRVHWLALLRAPWCGLTLADLHALIGQDAHTSVLALLHTPSVLARLSADGQQRARHVRDVMQSALDMRGRVATSRWVHNTWLRLGGAQCLWHENDVEDVQAFFARIASLELAGQFSPEALAEDVKKLYAASPADADQRLQFMTIHKSKGLEFDTVILPGLEGANPADDPSLVIWEEVALPTGNPALIAAPFIPTARKRSLPHATTYDYLTSLDRDRASFEDARVLYVAATRAERALHLLGVAKRDKEGLPRPRANSFLALLWPAVAAQFTAENNCFTPANPAVSQASLSTFVPQLIRLAQAQIPALLQVQTQSNHYRPDNRQPDIREPSMLEVSASVPASAASLPETPSLAKPTLATVSPATPVLATQGNTSSASDDTLETAIGTLAHLYMQWIAQQGLAAWQPHIESDFCKLIPAMQRWMQHQGHAPARALQGATQVARLLCITTQSAAGRWLLQAHPQAASELAIETQHGGKKVIDRTFVADGVRWIIDYKSTPVVASDDLQQIAARYKPQLSAYAQLFAEEGLPICTAVFFLSVGQWVAVEA